MLTNCDMTIFNRYVENRETKYQRSHVIGVHWEDTKGANILKSGLESADASQIYIPFEHGENYLPPKKWKKNREGHFTLQEEDVVVKGIIKDEFTSVKDLEKRYDFVRMITTVDTRDYGSYKLRHWEVGAK